MNHISQTNSEFASEPNEQHCAVAELLALARAQLSAARSSELQAHLLTCADCYALYQDAEAFGVPVQPGDPSVSEAQIQGDWQRLQSQLLPAEPDAGFWSPWFAVLFEAMPRWAWALTAGVVLALGVGAAWLWRARQAVPPAPVILTQAAKPETLPPVIPTIAPVRETPVPAATKHSAPMVTNLDYLVAVVTLSSGEKGETDVAATPPLRVPTEARQFRFKLSKLKPLEFPEYKVELSDTTGRVRQVAHGVAGQDKLIEVSFARAGLADGEYRLRVSGQGHTGADETPLTATVKLVFK